MNHLDHYAMDIAHSWIWQVASEPATDGIPLPLDGGNNVDVKDGISVCPEGSKCPSFGEPWRLRHYVLSTWFVQLYFYY